MYDDFSSPKFKALWAELEKELNDRSSRRWSFMVRLENIKRDGNYVSCDCYTEGRRDEHFTMKVDLTDNGKSVCSIEKGYATQMASIAVFRLVIDCKNSGRNLPTEYSYYWY